MSSTLGQSVLSFWFDEIDSARWWSKDTQFDKEIESRFGTTHASAHQCELFEWRETAQGRLAEIIVLDQFSRNIYRDSPRAFASDALALCLAQEAVSLEIDKALPAGQLSFLYMPFMHSESKIIHERAVELFTENGSKNSLDFELRHKAIIDQFGRYPHRNAILDRQSTEQELAFLKEKNSSF